jgi:hypothetical protein
MGTLGRRLAGMEARVAAVQERRQAEQVAAETGAAPGEVLEFFRGMRAALGHLQVRLGRKPTEAEQVTAIAEHFDIPEQELRRLAARHHEKAQR